jgi:predicted ATPase
MTKNNFYVLTGGPGGGKTTLLQALQNMGYNYVPETARAIIKKRLGAGLPPRPAPIEFAMQMFELDTENFITNSGVEAPLFFDRSFLDSAGLIYELNNTVFETVKPFIQANGFNTKVFITPPWREIYSTDTERDQTFEEAQQVYNKLHNWYKANGYNLVVLPEAPIDKRVNFILQHINMQG